LNGAENGVEVRCQWNVVVSLNPKEAKQIFLNGGGSGKDFRIDASIWVKTNEAGCKSKNFGKGLFGIFYPLNIIFNTQGVRLDIAGTVIQQNSSGVCNPFSVSGSTALTPGSNNASIELTVPLSGKNGADLGKLSSSHTIRKLPGTFFGFGITVPRLVLD
jgi:hypothetical protein